MAISRLTGQDAKGLGGSGTATATYPGATTAGNLLVASAMGTSGTDTLAITGWTKGVHSETGTSVAVFYKLADGTEHDVQVTGGTGVTKIHIYEYTGNANPIALDGTNTGSNTATQAAAGASLTTTNAADLVFAAISFATAVTAPAATSPFSLRQVDATIRLADADDITTATGTYAAGWSWTTSANTRNVIIAFKAAAVFPVTGSVSAVSAESGTVTGLLAATGTDPGVSAASGNVTLLAPLSATVAAVSDDTGTATALALASGSTGGVSGQTGTVTALLPASGSVAGVSGTSGSSWLLGAASGAGAAVSGVAGAISKYVTATGVVQALSGIAGSVTPLLQAAGSALGISSVRGAVVKVIPHHPAAVERLANVVTEDRRAFIAAENRVTAIPAENRYKEVS